jgi:hypothetical protein
MIELSTSVKDAPDVVAYVTAPLRKLQALGWREILTARRQGGDPDVLVSEFWAKYDKAFAEAERRADQTANRLGVPPIEVDRHVLDAAAAVCERTPERMTRWGAVIPKKFETVSASVPTIVATRPRSTVKRHVRAARTVTPSRGDPDDDDPDGEPPGPVHISAAIAALLDEIGGPR